MSNSDVFQRVCDALVHTTALTVPQIRGTVRLALRAAGLEASLISADEMRAVVRTILPQKLRAQGVSDVELVRVLDAVSKAIDVDAPTDRSGPASVFDRLDKARKGD
ncbi:MAG: hypothetical protein AAFU77_17165 [Myxococcota bacterium]